MAKLPKDISDFMEKYGVTSDEIWEVRSGAYAMKHKALERVAVQCGIVFETLQVLAIDLKEKLVAVSVTGRRDLEGGEILRGVPRVRQESSTGEAAPYNNKNGYPLAMAEKRAKDRVILKLLSVHGSLYSEDEAEDFKRENPHVTRPNDVQEPIERDEHGQPVDNIPLGTSAIVKSKAQAREDWAACEKEIRAINNVKVLQAWGHRCADRVAAFPKDWAEMLRGTYREHMNELKSKPEAA